MQGLIVDLLAHRKHDDHRHKNGEAGKDLGGRQLLHAHGLTQKAEDDDDAGEAGDREHDGRGHGKHGEQKEDFQQHRDFRRFRRAAGQREGHGGQAEILRRESQVRQQDQQACRQQARRAGLPP